MENQIFSHGDNLLGQHVDAMVAKDSEFFVVHVRKATDEEIRENCKEA